MLKTIYFEYKEKHENHKIMKQRKNHGQLQHIQIKNLKLSEHFHGIE
jgi:hypothetical protein